MRTILFVRAVVSSAFAFVAVAVFAPATATQTGPTEGQAGFVVASNGFAEEFCRRQGVLVNSPSSPTIPDDE